MPVVGPKEQAGRQLRASMPGAGHRLWNQLAVDDLVKAQLFRDGEQILHRPAGRVFQGDRHGPRLSGFLVGRQQVIA
jgi:hypothetical protein